MSCVYKHCFSGRPIFKCLEKSQILDGMNNLDVFCSRMYTYAKDPQDWFAVIFKAPFPKR